MSTDLAKALNGSFRTVASVNTARAASQCIESATRFWLDSYRDQHWTIVTVDLTLLTNIVASESPAHISTKNLGILQRYHLQDFNDTHTLFIYSTDKYTENWVHEWIHSKALTDLATNRVLNVQRDDRGPILDLTA